MGDLSLLSRALISILLYLSFLSLTSVFLSIALSSSTDRSTVPNGKISRRITEQNSSLYLGAEAKFEINSKSITFLITAVFQDPLGTILHYNASLLV